jgi:long-chain acyl-CoA synthetase
VSGRSYVANEAQVPTGTLPGLFLDAVRRFGDAPAFGFLPRPGTLETVGYRETLARVKRVAAALEASGVTRGDRAAIFADNRPEWSLTDYGCLCSGVVDVPIYPTLTARQVAYILRDSGAKVLFTQGGEAFQTARDAVAECPHPVRMVVYDDADGLPAGAIRWSRFLEDGAERAAAWSEGTFRERAEQAGPEDVATILYTSGTTGEPKGVMLTHDNIFSNVMACSRVLELGPEDRTASFLPLSHIFQRMVDYLFLHVGCLIAYPRSMQTVVEDFGVIRPTVAVSVPRLYEKIYNGVMDARGVKKKIIDWAAGVADRAAEARLAGREPGGVLAVQYAVANRLVFSKVKEAVGGELRIFVSGGGPLSPALNRFFYSIGLTILEGYGLTETSPVTNVNTLDDFRIGTVGKPVPGTEIRIAEDGEILVRGRQVMKGYYNRPDATAEAIDEEGWFRTGDLGTLDEDGFLTITDRKKDIIVTAGGKNVAPQPIENRLTSNPYVEQAVMVGDRRKYVSLLVVPAFEPLEAWAREEGIEWGDREDLVENSRVKEFVEGQVMAELADVASYERPKRVALLPEAFSIEKGTMTPTMKVRRGVVQKRFDRLIDQLYEGEAADAIHDR